MRSLSDNPRDVGGWVWGVCGGGTCTEFENGPFFGDLGSFAGLLLCTPYVTGVAVVMPQRRCWLLVLVMPKLDIFCVSLT